MKFFTPRWTNPDLPNHETFEAQRRREHRQSKFEGRRREDDNVKREPKIAVRKVWGI